MKEFKNLSVRERILKTTKEQFYLKGYDSTSISDIIESASVSRAGFYGNFQSKEELGKEYLDLWKLEINQRFSRLTDSCSSPLQFTKLWYRFLILGIRKGESNGCPLSNFAASRNIQQNSWLKYQQDALNDWLDVMVRLIKRSEIEGTFCSEEKPESIARNFFLIYQGALAMWKIDGEIAHLKEGRQLTEYYLKNISICR
ncbi:MAG: TetR/AcrR family transcriptional regulator [Leptospiraceae bacterium]|nr:TetR/AcrR family transcriptional regulator [Leptospiraceae bacterium]MCP5502104.1 TetR/AcrR family transcriptional regulator [Leptospiraceae bacterium]